MKPTLVHESLGVVPPCSGLGLYLMGSEVSQCNCPQYAQATKFVLVARAKQIRYVDRIFQRNTKSECLLRNRVVYRDQFPLWVFHWVIFHKLAGSSVMRLEKIPSHPPLPVEGGLEGPLTVGCSEGRGWALVWLCQGLDSYI